MAIDWKSFYPRLIAGVRIPAVSSWVFPPRRAIVRDLYVDLKEVAERVAAQPQRVAMVFVYADHVHVPGDFTLGIEGQAWIIIARRIVFEPNAGIRIDWTTSAAGALKIHAQDVDFEGTEPPIHAQLPDGGERHLSEKETITPTGLSMTRFPEETIVTTGEGLETLLAEDSPLALSLGSIFQVATLLVHDPELAGVGRSQLAWVQACAAQSPVQSGLMLQSAGMLALAQTSSPDAIFVPELSRTIYAETARASIPLVKEYERQYERFTDQRETIEARIEAAELLVQKAEDTVAFSKSLIEQAEANLRNAVSAFEIAERNVRRQQESVEKVAVQFGVSIAIWQERRKLQASIQIISAVVTFGAAVGKLAYGDPSGAPAAANSAMAALDGVAKGGEAAAKAVKLKKTMTDLKKVLMSLVEVFKLAQLLLKAGSALSAAGAVARELGSRDNDASSLAHAPEAWDIFGIQADDALQPAIDNEIQGAVQYRQELRILVVHGKALTTARAAVVTVGQELARLHLLIQLHEKDRVRMTQHLEQLKASREPNDALQQAFFQRYLDAKRSLYVALEQYRAAYFYWALVPSSVKPSLTDRVSVFENGLRELADMALDNATALLRFRPRPHPFNQIVHIKNPDILASLKESRQTTWTIALDAPEVRGLDRVRITSVRIWLDGAASRDPLFIVITNSGNYLDRLGTGTSHPERFIFTTRPLEKVFKYALDGSGPRIIVDGTVDEELEYSYFVPTMFSQWTIRLPNETNPEVDLDALAGIRMEVKGSVIPSTLLTM